MTLKSMFLPLQHAASEKHLKTETRKEILKGFFGSLPLFQATVPCLVTDL